MVVRSSSVRKASPTPFQLCCVQPRSFYKQKPPIDGVQILDIFAGAGGFSLGFSLAGCRVQAAIEIDSWASETIKLNHNECPVVTTDITLLTDSEILRYGRDCKIVIGGPPCQGFSIANRKAGDPADPRNSLFREFVRTVSLVQPAVFLLENVPGLLKRRSQSKVPVIDIIVKELESLGYTVDFRIIEAQSFGVPQLRPRLFVIGYRNPPKQVWPSATHGNVHAGDDLFSDLGLLPYVNVWDAISDLPEIDARQGAEEMQYGNLPSNDYQLLMRANSTKIYNNVSMNHSKRLVERFSHVACGNSGSHVPTEHQARKRGDYSLLSGKNYSQNNRRMHPDKPCHTIPASFYANFIHPFKHRNFTPREGARIQSFPDWYRFYGKPTVVSTKLLAREERVNELHLCQYNQIGNAVPPLLAYQLARHILAQL